MIASDSLNMSSTSDAIQIVHALPARDLPREMAERRYTNQTTSPASSSDLTIMQHCNNHSAENPESTSDKSRPRTFGTKVRKLAFPSLYRNSPEGPYISKLAINNSTTTGPQKPCDYRGPGVLVSRKPTPTLKLASLLRHHTRPSVTMCSDEMMRR